jgi:hypothetical protein
MEENIKIKVEETGYIWDLKKLKRLAQIVKKNEEEAKMIEKKEKMAEMMPQKCQD